jgi:hypothetical protein
LHINRSSCAHFIPSPYLIWCDGNKAESVKLTIRLTCSDEFLGLDIEEGRSELRKLS